MTIEIAISDEEAVEKVQVLSKYHGYNENGDGYSYDWYYACHVDRIEDHAGSLTSPPWKLTWNTQWIHGQVRPLS